MRKALILGLALLLIAPAVFAQDALMKGSWSIGNGVNTAGAFSSSIGYFYNDNLEVGANLGFSSNSYGDASSSNMGFGLGAAYYLSQMGPGYPFGQAGLSYSSGSSNSGAPNAPDVKTSGYNIDFGVGYLWFLNERASWYGKVGLGIGSSSSDAGGGSTSTSSSSFGLMVGLKVFVF